MKLREKMSGLPARGQKGCENRSNIDLGEIENAIKDLKKALELRPSDARYFKWLKEAEGKIES